MKGRKGGECAERRWGQLLEKDTAYAFKVKLLSQANLERCRGRVRGVNRGGEGRLRAEAVLPPQKLSVEKSSGLGGQWTAKGEHGVVGRAGGHYCKSFSGKRGRNVWAIINPIAGNWNRKREVAGPQWKEKNISDCILERKPLWDQPLNIKKKNVWLPEG